MFIGQRIHSSLFTIHRTKVDGKQIGGVSFVTEMSTLQAHRAYPLLTCFNDSADTGFGLVSAKTGVMAVFVLDEHNGEGRNSQGELVQWVFRPCADAVRRNPGLEGARVVIFNT